MAKYHNAKPFLASFLVHKVFWDVIKALHIFYHHMRNRMNVAMFLHFFFFSILNCPLMKTNLHLRDTCINWLFCLVRFWQCLLGSIELKQLFLHVYFDLEQVFCHSNQISIKIHYHVSNPLICKKKSNLYAKKNSILIFSINAFQRKNLNQIASQCAFCLPFWLLFFQTGNSSHGFSVSIAVWHLSDW